jgi:hypothetical protein
MFVVSQICFRCIYEQHHPESRKLVIPSLSKQFYEICTILNNTVNIIQTEAGDNDPTKLLYCALSQLAFIYVHTVCPLPPLFSYKYYTQRAHTQPLYFIYSS